jgi:hypothetical protein
MKPAAFYFALVFGAGFLLGPFRVLWLVPRIGTRAAELIELPLMLVAIFYAARFVNRRFPASSRIRVGLVALMFLLAAEIFLGWILRRASPMQVLFDRDPISGTAYYASLVVFAAMPWWLTRE